MNSVVRLLVVGLFLTFFLASCVIDADKGEEPLDTNSSTTEESSSQDAPSSSGGQPPQGGSASSGGQSSQNVPTSRDEQPSADDDDRSSLSDTPLPPPEEPTPPFDEDPLSLPEEPSSPFDDVPLSSPDEPSSPPPSNGDEVSPGDNPPDEPEFFINMSGHVHMGLFPLVGNISVYQLDEMGQRTGEYVESTFDGSYEIAVPWVGSSELELKIVEFKNLVGSKLEVDPFVLNIFKTIEAVEEVYSNPNIFSHIATARAQYLMKGGAITIEQAFGKAVADTRKAFGLTSLSEVDMLSETDGSSEWAADNANLLLLTHVLSDEYFDTGSRIQSITTEFIDDGKINQSSGFDFSPFIEKAGSVDFNDLNFRMGVMMGYVDPPDIDDLTKASAPKLQNMLDTGNEVFMEFATSEGEFPLPSWAGNVGQTNFVINSKLGFVEEVKYTGKDGLRSEETYGSDQQLKAFSLALNGVAMTASRTVEGSFHVNVNDENSGESFTRIVPIEEVLALPEISAPEETPVLSPTVMSKSSVDSHLIPSSLTSRVNVTRCGKPYDNANVRINVAATSLNGMEFNGPRPASKVAGVPGAYEADLRMADPVDFIGEEVERCKAVFETFDNLGKVKTLFFDDAAAGKVVIALCDGFGYQETDSSKLFCKVLSSAVLAIVTRRNLLDFSDLASLLKVCEFHYASLLTSQFNLSYEVRAVVNPVNQPYQFSHSDPQTLETLGAGASGPTFNVALKQEELTIESLFTDPENPSANEGYDLKAQLSCVTEETDTKLLVVRKMEDDNLDEAEKIDSLGPTEDPFPEYLFHEMPPGAIEDRFVLRLKSASSEKEVIQSLIIKPVPAISVEVNGQTVNPNEIQTFDSPPHYDFGEVELGQDVDKVSIVIDNTGKGILKIDSILNIDLASIEDFVLPDITFPIVIDPGESETLQVAFKPMEEWEKRAVIRVSSNDPNTPNIDITLEGAGIPIDCSVYDDLVVGSWNVRHAESASPHIAEFLADGTGVYMHDGKEYEFNWFVAPWNKPLRSPWSTTSAPDRPLGTEPGCILYDTGFWHFAYDGLVRSNLQIPLIGFSKYSLGGPYGWPDWPDLNYFGHDLSQEEALVIYRKN